MAAMNGRDPQTRPEVYAREIVLLREMHEAERKLQVIRIGDLGIAALPAEVYAITGLKLKLQCPLGQMFNIELANGSIGYIPPPELRPLGGYNTWPARHTATQNDIETIMVNELLEMFEEVTGRPRRKIVLSQGPAAARTLAQKPLAYWRLGEIEGNRAWDASGHDHHGTYETGYALYLDGPDRDDLRSGGEQPRAVQFAGGRMKAQLDCGTRLRGRVLVLERLAQRQPQRHGLPDLAGARRRQEVPRRPPGNQRHRRGKRHGRTAVLLQRR